MASRTRRPCDVASEIGVRLYQQALYPLVALLKLLSKLLYFCGLARIRLRQGSNYLLIFRCRFWIWWIAHGWKVPEWEVRRQAAYKADRGL